MIRIQATTIAKIPSDNSRASRLAVVYIPTDKDTLKLMLTRSLRMTFAEEIQWRWQTFGRKSDPETLDSIELRYERQHTPNLLFALGAYDSRKYQL